MSKDRIYEIIVGHTREVVPSLDSHPFQQTDSLKSLGANSIDRADIIMMTLFAGRQRTQAEFDELLSAAGFKPVDAMPTDDGSKIFVGVPV